MDTMRIFALAGALLAAVAAAAQPAGRKSWSEGWASSQDATYAKVLSVTQRDLRKDIRLEVDGAFPVAVVYVNGQEAGRPSGASVCWSVEIGPYLVPGSNVVELDLGGRSPGSGNIWLTATEKTAVGLWGSALSIRPGEDGTARVTQRLTLRTDGLQVADIHTLILLRTSRGPVPVAEARSTERVYDGKEVEQSFDLLEARLWSPETPNLYVARTTVETAGGTKDVYDTPFGIRNVEFRPDGLYLNGVRTVLKSLSPGESVPDWDVWTRRLLVLRKVGCNTLEIGPDLLLPQLLDLCDELGFLVADVFPSPEEERAMALIRRDRNHPSVVLWDVPGELADVFRREDPARPVADSVHRLNPVKPEWEMRPAGNKLVPSIDFKGEDFWFVTVPDPAARVSFSVQGPAKIAGTEAGDPAAPLGMASALIRRTGEGPVTLTVMAKGFKKAVITL